MLAGLSENAAAARGKWYANNKSIHAMARIDHISRDLNFLTDSLCDGRATGTPGIAAAAFWITEKFESSRLLPFGGSYARSFFAGGDKRCGRNIIGMLPAKQGKSSASYIIVGAHYDHIGRINGVLYPGADSNASGTVALTTIAEMLDFSKKIGRVYDCNIILVAFDSKELSLTGSKHFMTLLDAGSLIDPLSGERVTKDKIRCMVNIDQIGGSQPLSKNGRKDFLMMLGKESLNEYDRHVLSMCNKYYGTGLALSYTYFGSENFSKLFYTELGDHSAFVKAGIPSVFFTTGITMNNNKPWDNAESIDLDILRRRIILIWQWISMMA